MRAEGKVLEGEAGVAVAFRRAQFVFVLAAIVGAALAASSAGQGPPTGSPPGLDKAIAAKEKHADRLLDQPGVAGIGVGLNPAGKPVIRLYKERENVGDIPEDLEGVPVTQVRTGVIAPRAPTDRFPRPVPIGVSSGLADFATGTLGARVTDGTNVYALSNNHVFAGINTASVGDPITQPGPEDGGSDPGDRIGTLFDYQPINFEGGDNTMDAAIALTTVGDVGTATPPDGYGEPSTTPTAASIGMAVQKYGRTTGLQLGSVAETNVTVDVCYVPILEFCLQEARFVNQVSVTPGPFSAPGDSGSLIVTQGSNQPVALLFAGGEGLTIGNPINAVLQRFGVTIEGGAPANGPPTAPQNLAAIAGDASVALSWTAPAFDGGSTISNYKVLRGTSPNPTVVVGTPTGTSFNDSGLTNGQTYYYRVVAVNANGDSPTSNEVSATPAALVPPTMPLTMLDDFNRPNENPLFDQNRWANSIIGGSTESGHYVTSNQLGCSVTTTCTAWRSNAQYGPDVEVYARVAVLPGVGNVIRLNVRLQNPGVGPLTGYLIRANQLSGTDQIWIERFDNGSAVTRLTINQELAAGDVLLLRALGPSIELWRLNGSGWSRLGNVHDTTYGTAGHVGVGMRGTIGRLDDFGARSLGAPSPDTQPPSAPGTLSASAVSSSRVDLSWGAATDNVGVAQYRIERCQGAGCSNFAEIATTPSTSYQNTGLNPSTSYSYRVRAEDAVLLLGPYSNEASATTPAPPDTDPPSASGTLSASAVSSTRIDLSWGAATDNVGVTQYRIERCSGAGCSDFAEIDTTTATSYQNTGLASSTSYTYRVRAEDAASNLGPYSNEASATTPAPPDTEAPSAPGTLSASATSTSQVDLSWGPATDNVGVVQYRIERCQGAGCSNFSEIATTPSTSYQNTGLNPSTSYSYRVRAEDSASNLGPYSNETSATTSSGVSPPSEPLPVIDGFNRRNENPLAGGWSNGVNPVETGLRVVSNTLGCTRAAVCSAWRNTGTFGPDTEVWARVTTLPGTSNDVRLYARLQQPSTPGYDGYVLRATQSSGTDQVTLERIDNGGLVSLLGIPYELAAGDTLLLRAQGSTLEAWLRRGSTWTLLGSVNDTTYGAEGYVGVGLRGKTGRLDDFGAR